MQGLRLFYGGFMTKKEFRKALLRGQGRCVLAVRSAPEKYRSEVLWACGHKIAYDAQCEGTRAWYIDEIVRCYEDRTEFVAAASDALIQTPSDRDWKIFYFAELLGHFAADGDVRAAETLTQKYDALYEMLMAQDRPEGICSEAFDFEALCMVRATDIRSFLRIAGDVGRLLRTRCGYEEDFSALRGEEKASWRRALARRAETDPDLAAYQRSAGIEWTDTQPEKAENDERPPMPAQDRLSSIWLKKYGTPEEKAHYARIYREAQTLEERRKALLKFLKCPYPDNPVPIIADADAADPALRECAWQALGQICHPDVRAFALERLSRTPEYAIQPLLANYRPEDDALLTELVQRTPVDRREVHPWHGIQFDLLTADYKHLKLPQTVLRHIYETTYCSNCRNRAVRRLGRQRQLSDEMLQECLWDSLDDTRQYAAQLLRRRGKKR